MARELDGDCALYADWSVPKVFAASRAQAGRGEGAPPDPAILALHYWMYKILHAEGRASQYSLQILREAEEDDGLAHQLDGGAASIEQLVRGLQQAKMTQVHG